MKKLMILIAVLFITITANAQDKTYINYNYLTISEEAGQSETTQADILVVLNKSDLSFTVHVNGVRLVKLRAVTATITGYFPDGTKYTKVRMISVKGDYCWLYYSNGDTALVDDGGLVVFTNELK